MSVSNETAEALGLGPILLSAIIAVGAYLLQFVGATILAHQQHKREKARLRNDNELQRIDYQLGSVYGPMRGRLLSSKSAFTMLVKRWGLFDDIPAFMEAVSKQSDDSPTPLQKDWMLWVEHILQPSNRALCDVILEHAAGFDTMPGFLANIVAHTKEFEVILAKWQNGDLSHMITMLPFDDRINAFVEGEFARLLNRKRVILEAKKQEHNFASESEEELMSGIELHGETRGYDDQELRRPSNPVKMLVI